MVERLIYSKDKGKKEMCATCRDDIEKVNKSDNNRPSVLEKLTLNVFFHYMSTKKSKKSGGYHSATSYGGVQSPLTHMYLMSGKTIDGEFKK